MAVLAIKIEDISTLPMNEFYDYGGWCYGLSRSRLEGGDDCINLEDFYECTIQSERLKDVPVVFVQERNEEFYIAGWYREAEVHQKIKRPSLFLEGNIKADARKVWLVPETMRKQVLNCCFGPKYYEVIEMDDSRYQPVMDYINYYSGQNAFIHMAYVNNFLDSKVKKSYDSCMERCTLLAQRLMSDECQDIREIAQMEAYAEQACKLNGRSADGQYYLAMACHQLGKVKKAMKAIEKALKMEPGASDILAMKGHILISMGYVDAAAETFHQAWQAEGDDAYLMLEGRAWLFKGQMDKALACFKQMGNKQLLDDAGINLKDMEKRWPFMNVRGFHLKHLFGK